MQVVQPLPLRLPVGQRGLSLLIVPQLLAQRLCLGGRQLAVHKGMQGAALFCACWGGWVCRVHGGGSGQGGYLRRRSAGVVPAAAAAPAWAAGTAGAVPDVGSRSISTRRRMRARDRRDMTVPTGMLRMRAVSS